MLGLSEHVVRSVALGQSHRSVGGCRKPPAKILKMLAAVPRHPQTGGKLREGDVASIRYLAQSKDAWNQQELAPVFGVTAAMISRILRRVSHRDIEPRRPSRAVYAKLARIERNAWSGEKLNQERVRWVRWLLASGYSCTAIALVFNVTATAISQINTGRRWRRAKGSAKPPARIIATIDDSA